MRPRHVPPTVEESRNTAPTGGTDDALTPIPLPQGGGRRLHDHLATLPARLLGRLATAKERRGRTTRRDRTPSRPRLLVHPARPGRDRAARPGRARTHARA